ncbi:MAG: D-alanine--D-alanine ligase [Deltaproteobacteria bacterium]|nr:D-alanine--D-alanine ligase [Deltaproteobacteria bacterium]MBW2420306.1 D-alanine--D-alanine ligase [Deltaproteobacteria bacterium]
MAKLRVGLLFGGRSVEHEVSVTSATSILEALDASRYDVTLIAIDHAGTWHAGSRELPPEAILEEPEVVLPAAPGGEVLAPPGGAPALAGGVVAQLDVIFPIVHGRGGEDGCLQGLLELAGVPYVGSGVLGSALQMDKDVAKRLLAAAGLPVVPWVTLQGEELQEGRREALASRAAEELGLPVFVKPANSGSSVGIHRAEDAGAVARAVADAARYDSKVVIEQAVDAREIEVAIIGNDSPEASIPGEIRTQSAFYDYEAKYADESTELCIPAVLSDEASERLRGLAVEAFRVLEGQGLGRVDFLVSRSDEREVFINELNSLPGFTDGSMYPRLWEATGVAYPALVDRLIELALERHRRHSKLVTLFRSEG